MGLNNFPLETPRPSTRMEIGIEIEIVGSLLHAIATWPLSIGELIFAGLLRELVILYTVAKNIDAHSFYLPIKSSSSFHYGLSLCLV